MEYEVYLLDDRMNLSHKGEAIIATNNLGIASSYCYEYHKKYNKPVCVYQPRHGYYREYYASWLNQEEEDMALPKNITMTRDGGRFWPAMAFRHVFTYIVLVPVLIGMIIAILNPLWFRDDFFRWIESTVNKIAQWRNYKVYAIYLGTDPELWHSLKD